MINFTYYLYFVILSFVWGCLVGNIDNSFHFVRRKEADFSSSGEEPLPEAGRGTWHCLPKGLASWLPSDPEGTRSQGSGEALGPATGSSAPCCC